MFGAGSKYQGRREFVETQKVGQRLRRLKLERCDECSFDRGEEIPDLEEQRCQMKGVMLVPRPARIDGSYQLPDPRACCH